jgi:hypothetical protein
MDALADFGAKLTNLAYRCSFGALADLVLVVSRHSFSGGGEHAEKLLSHDLKMPKQSFKGLFGTL